MQAKADIRKTMLERRRALGEAERALASQQICATLQSLALPASSIVAGYMAIRGEVDIAPALAFFHGQNIPVCLPSVVKPERILQFLRWTPGAEMQAGRHNILHPAGGQLLVPTLLLVPLVAFDRRGHRLGYGAGHYDATIAQLKQSNPALQTVGVGYSFQETEALPAEAHDMKLDKIVTEHEIIILR